jgi:hypothetical protein
MTPSNKSQVFGWSISQEGFTQNKALPGWRFWLKAGASNRWWPHQMASLENMQNFQGFQVPRFKNGGFIIRKTWNFKNMLILALDMLVLLLNRMI